MPLEALSLFVFALLGGLVAFRFKNIEPLKFRLVLTFSGAYLLSITIVHLLPELFEMIEHGHGEVSAVEVGAFMLVGFFIQKVLEYFSAGVEHGHWHRHEGHSFVPWIIVLSLSLHAFLEGTVLTHDHTGHDHGDNHFTMLIGIILHKMPASFVLTSILLAETGKKRKAFLLLILFALASPAGLMLCEYFYLEQFFSQKFFTLLYAVVAGNLLHIATTIFFESNPEHRFDGGKLTVTLLGVMLALATQFWL